jgi:four helix bundle protein
MQEQGTRNEEQGRGFRSLLAWQKADALASAVYRSLRELPSADRWLAVQAVRAAVSVPANIAEGYGRGSLGDYLRFLDIAQGSLAELEYYLVFLEREGLLDDRQSSALQELHVETGRLLRGLWRSLKQKLERGDWDHTGRVREERAVYVAELLEYDGGAVE